MGKGVYCQLYIFGVSEVLTASIDNMGIDNNILTLGGIWCLNFSEFLQGSLVGLFFEERSFTLS